MSKLMSDLTNLSESRKADGNIIIEEADSNPAETLVAPEYKGIYFLSFLMILLIGFSVLSMSISLKTFKQLEYSWVDSKAILETLSKQQKDLAALEMLITEKSTGEFVQVESLKTQMNELKVSANKKEKEFSEIKNSYNDLKISTQKSIKELQLSSKLILDKYILLNDQVQKFNKDNLFSSNTY